MARSRKAPDTAVSAAEELVAPLMHRAARIEDVFHEWRERRGRKRGLKTTIIPYTGYGSTTWVRVLCRVVLTRGAESKQRAAKIRGWRSFFSIPVDDVAITVTAGDKSFELTADRGGVIDARIEVALDPGWHEITLTAADINPVTSNIFIVDPSTTFGVLSDIDDTVMVTALPRPLLAAWNTFVLDEHARRPVPGMAVLYERLLRAHPGSPIVYLSTGAWNVAPTLGRFLHRNLYPRGTLLLTDWGPTHDRWFRSGREHKAGNLARLASEFPNLKWLLVGDDGQHDEELYADFLAAHPGNVEAIAIRQLSTSEAVLAGGRSRAVNNSTDDVPWVYAPDGAGLAEQLADAGVLTDGKA
jgi:phosphatidate phosphatase APP1